MACHDILFKEKSCLKIKAVYSVLLHIMIYIKLSVVFLGMEFQFFSDSGKKPPFLQWVLIISVILIKEVFVFKEESPILICSYFPLELE